MSASILTHGDLLFLDGKDPFGYVVPEQFVGAAVQSANQDAANQFVDLACLCYDDPHYDHRSFHARAHDMLESHPALSGANIWAAAVAGNTFAVESFLRDDPALVNRQGPHGWAPLFCACYSRVKPVDPSHSTYEGAKLLLDRGADPNAHTSNITIRPAATVRDVSRH